MPAKKPKPKTTKEEGITYVTSFGTTFTATDLADAEVLHDYQQHNDRGISLTDKQKNLIFTDKSTYEVIDPKGEVDKELGQRITNMCEKIQLWSKIELGYADGIFWYGIGVFNQFWDYEGSECILRELNYLPAYTFRNAGGNQDLTYSEILPGITLDDKKQIEFWQTNEIGVTNQLKTENIFWMKDPSSANLTGKSIMRPIIPILEMIKYSWATIMQYMNRVGAPIIFIKITDPQPASTRTGGVSDVDYAIELLEKWGKNTGFILRENMEIIELNLKENSNNIETLEALNIMVIDYMTPSSFISHSTGQSLNDSSKSLENFFYKFIKGIHTWLIEPVERLLQQYLDKNGFEGYILNVHIPSPSVDQSEIKLKQAEVAINSPEPILSKNEIRERLGAGTLDKTGLKDLVNEFARAPAQIPTGFESNISTHEQTLQKKLQAVSAEFSEDVIKALKYEEE